MDKKQQINLWYVIAAVVVILALQNYFQGQQVEQVAYSEFQKMLEEGRIAEIAITDTSIRGELREPLPDGRRYIHTVRVDPEFAEDLAQYGVKFTGVVQSNWISNLLSWVLPARGEVGAIVGRPPAGEGRCWYRLARGQYSTDRRAPELRSPDDSRSARLSGLPPGRGLALFPSALSRMAR